MFQKEDDAFVFCCCVRVLCLSHISPESSKALQSDLKIPSGKQNEGSLI